MLDFEKLSKDHKKMFPKADLLSQCMKVGEELREFKEAVSNEKAIRELADVAICCIGIYRFDKDIAEAIYMNAMTYADVLGIRAKIEAEVDRKWQVNSKRKWVFENGVYKHKGIDGNE